MASATKEQKAAIRKLTRRANRRIERAVGGQKRFLESVVSSITGDKKFSAATKGLTYTQAAAKLKSLEQFLGRMSTTRVGWDWIKMEIVHKARLSLDKQGYTISDEELADILMQVDAENKTEYYRAIDLVQAEKDAGADNVNFDRINELITSKITAQEALKMSIEARKARLQK